METKMSRRSSRKRPSYRGWFTKKKKNSNTIRPLPRSLPTSWDDYFRYREHMVASFKNLLEGNSSEFETGQKSHIKKLSEFQHVDEFEETQEDGQESLEMSVFFIRGTIEATLKNERRVRKELDTLKYHYTIRIMKNGKREQKPVNDALNNISRKLTSWMETYERRPHALPEAVKLPKPKDRKYIQV